MILQLCHPIFWVSINYRQHGPHNSSKQPSPATNQMARLFVSIRSVSAVMECSFRCSQKTACWTTCFLFVLQTLSKYWQESLSSFGWWVIFLYFLQHSTWMFPKMVVPQIIHFNECSKFSIINHPFLGPTPIFMGNTHMFSFLCGFQPSAAPFPKPQPSPLFSVSP